MAMSSTPARRSLAATLIPALPPPTMRTRWCIDETAIRPPSVEFWADTSPVDDALSFAVIGD
jgi:hypothetical protein